MTDDKKTPDKLTAGADPGRKPFLEAVFSSSFDGIFVIDAGGRYVEVNPSGCAMFGYTRAEILSSDISLLLYPEDVQGAFRNLDGILRGEGGGTRELRLRRKDGSQVWVELSVNFFTVGGVDYALGIKRDITRALMLKGELLEAKKRLEAKVAERTGALGRLNDTLRTIIRETSSVAGTEFFRSLVSHLASTLKFRYALVGEISEDGESIRMRALWAGEGFAESFDYKLAGTPCYNVAGKETCIYPSGVAGLFPEDTLLAEMGAESYIGVPLFDSRGGALGVLAALDDKPMEDIEFSREIMDMFALRAGLELERKKADDGLARSREMLQSIIDNSTAVIYVKDAAGRHMLINRRFEDIVQAARDELIGKTCHEVFPEGIADAMVANDGKVREAGGPVEFEEDVVHPDGTAHTYISVKFPVPGFPGAVCGMSTDLTEHKKMEAELFKAQKLDSIGVLAGGLAHDFNNLLLGIIGNVSVARNLLDSGGKVSMILGEVEKAALRSKELTRKLLTFSRGGAPTMEPSPIDRLVMDSASLVLRDTGVEAEYHFPEDLPFVEMDPGQMTQVVNNIILNALHAMPDGGVLRFSASRAAVSAKDGLPLKEGDYVRLSIKDHGMGMTPEVLSRIFDPFFTTKRKASGLGLSLSYSIVKKHGGLIRAESKAAEGTVVHIYLPARPASPAQGFEPEARKAAQDELVRGRGRVLVMDDEEMVRDVSTEMLELLGYEAECACDGAEAVELFMRARAQGRPFDAVILDLTVPDGMGGMETMERLLEIDPGTKAIVSSGYSRDPIMSEYRNYGFTSVIAKPYRVSEFSRAVKDVLKK